MANETQTNSLASTLPTYVSEAIVHELRDLTFLAQLLYWESLIGKPGASIVIPRYTDTPAMSDVTVGASETDPQANHQQTSDSVTMTAAPHVINFTISDWLKDTSAHNVLENSKPRASRAMAAKLETAIATLFNGFSGTNGATGQALTVATLDAAVTDFGVGAVELADRATIVLHRAQLGQLRADLISGIGGSLASIFTQMNVADIFGQQASRSVYANGLGSFYGIPVFQTNYVQKINSNVDYCGAILARSPGMKDPMAALAGLWKWAPEIRTYDKNPQNVMAQLVHGRMALVVSEIIDGAGRGIVGRV